MGNLGTQSDEKHQFIRHLCSLKPNGDAALEEHHVIICESYTTMTAPFTEIIVDFTISGDCQAISCSRLTVR